MMNAIFSFELRSWFKSMLFYVLIISFFLFSLVTMLGTGDYFDEVNQTTQIHKYLNSPYALSLNGFLFIKLLLFVAAIFGGFSLYRDYRNSAHAILYTYPMTKSYYLLGKLASVLFVIFIACSVSLLGLLIGDLMMGQANPKIGAFNIWAYLVALGIYLSPSLFIIGVFVFVSVGITRNIFSGFIVVICFVLLQMILENTLFNHQVLLALADPFGQSAFHLATEAWDIEKQNSNSLPINALVLANRALWILIAAGAYICFAKKFDFQYDTMLQFKKRGFKTNALNAAIVDQQEIESSINYNFSAWARFKSFLQMTLFDFKSIIGNWMFIVLSAFGGIAVFFIQLKVCNTGAFNLLPFTRIFLGAPMSIYTLILIFSTFIFSGLLIHRARQYNMNLILDATPVKNWQLIYSKIGAISLMQISQLFIFIIVSLIIQIINGYFVFEIELYFFHLFVLVLPVLFIWNLTSHFIHSLFPNLFFGLFILASIWLGVQSLEQIGIDSNIFKFNQQAVLEYSDFQGYGNQLKAYMLLLKYWFVVGLLLAAGTFVFWNRGCQSILKERLVIAKSRLSVQMLIFISALTVVFLCLAFKIYKLERIDKTNLINNSNKSELLEAYKSEWRLYGDLPQAKIDVIDLKIDLFPEAEDFKVEGSYVIVNSCETRIDTIFIRTGFDEITQLDWRGNAMLIKENAFMKTYLYVLNTSMMPGDSLILDFSIRNKPNTLLVRNSNILTNGSFIRHDILPRLAYQFVEHEYALVDSLANHYNYYSRDADNVRIHTTISTSMDQVAIAPGALISQKLIGNRKIYEYKTQTDVKLNFSFHSAAYELFEENYRGVSLQLYCHKGHGYNADLMMAGIKSALKFNSDRFGNYPHDQIRIIEFPHTEESFSATLMANNIPASEILFNINAQAMDDKVNLPFYVMAHELTHEWFGNQLVPADAEGAKMLTESITEYLSLCIYRMHFGKEAADKFLEVQFKRYNTGRKREQDVERPLNKVLSHQEYIAYGKGAIAFNEIAETIGQNQFHKALHEFLISYKSAKSNYPTTIDFIRILKEHASENDHPLIDEWLIETKNFQ